MLIVILTAVWKTTEMMLTCSVIKNKKVDMHTTKNVVVSALWSEEMICALGKVKEKKKAMPIGRTALKSLQSSLL